MALHERTETNTIYLEVKYHSICRTSKTPQPGFLEMTGTNPRTKQPFTKYYKPYDGVDGFVRKVEWYDRTDDQNNRYIGYKIHIDSDGQPVVLDLSYKTRAFDVFLRVAPNIDWTKRVHFSAWHDRKDDATAFLIRQPDRTGSPVKRAFTKDNPGGMPPGEFDDLTQKWNFTNQLRWLKKNFDANVLPLVAAAQDTIEHEISMRQLGDLVQAPTLKSQPQQVAPQTQKEKSAPADPFGDFDEPEFEPPDAGGIPF